MNEQNLGLMTSAARVVCVNSSFASRYGYPFRCMWAS